MSVESKPTLPGTPAALHRPGFARDTLTPEFPRGKVVGDYALEQLLAAGGCGAVYSARHCLLGRPAAIKILHRELSTSEEMFERFVREARVVNQIRHPNIVDVFGFGEIEPGRPYLVMELLPGVGLQAVLERRHRITAAEALAYLEPICGALAAAHEAGVVHRDLKASNVLVLEDGVPPRIKLLDFGIAKMVRPAPGDAQLTAVGQRLGTPTAMAPEQIRGDAIDGRTDIYALGVLLYQMLTGHYPFESEDPVELQRRHVEVPPRRPGELAAVPPLVEAVVLRCLEKRPDQRFATVGSFLEALRAAVGESIDRDGPLRRQPAVALFVEARIAPGLDHDDALLEELGTLLDRTEQELEHAGYHLFLATGSAILGVRVLPQDPVQALAERRAGIALACSLAALASPPPARVQLAVLVHRDAADLRERDGAVEVAGGPVVELESWLVADTSGLHLTPAASEGL